MPGFIAKRYDALDVFRGLTVCFMIIVNTPGNRSTAFSQLLHAKWNGFTLTDLVYPSFLFAVGNALSFVKKKWLTMKTGEVISVILRRSVLIFLIGYLLCLLASIQFEGGHFIFPSFKETRILGVLQRIALVYGITALMAFFLDIKTVIIVAVAILLLYWPALIYFASTPGPYSVTGNAVVRVDLWTLGASHLSKEGSFPFEPEGILSTPPSVAIAVAGLLTGNFIQTRIIDYKAVAKLIAIGVALVIIAYLWNFTFPVNKKLWTSSFILLGIGLDCIIISCIIFFVDLKGMTAGVYFFKVFGRNPLFIYLLAEMTAVVIEKIKIGEMNIRQCLYAEVFAKAGPYTGSLLFALFIMLFCWTVGYILDRNKIYIRV